MLIELENSPAINKFDMKKTLKVFFVMLFAFIIFSIGFVGCANSQVARRGIEDQYLDVGDHYAESRIGSSS